MHIIMHIIFLLRFGEGYIVTVRIQGDIPDLRPVIEYFNEKLPCATLKVIYSPPTIQSKTYPYFFYNIFYVFLNDRNVTIICSNTRFLQVW